MPQIIIQLLGSFEVTIDAQPMTKFSYAKVRALLALLASEADKAHARPLLAALLWPEQSEARARASLSQALLALRNALGENRFAQPLLLADAQQIRLNPHHDWLVDSGLFRAAMAKTARHQHYTSRSCGVCAAWLQQGIRWYRGNFLADLALADSVEFEEWSAQQRAELQQQALTALERLVERSMWCEDLAAALGYARQLVALEPWLEHNQRLLLAVLSLHGEAAAAQAQFRHFQQMLAQAFAAEPEPATLALNQQIENSDLKGLQLYRPARTLPRAPTQLIGRYDVLQAICDQLRVSEGRLVSIVGVGGIGKTRLACEAAYAMRFDFDDGVVFVELAALHDAAQVAPAIAHALGVQEQAQQPLHLTLQHALRTKHLLLVLDNFEHVLAAALFVAELLATCPTLHIVVTSRAPLLIRAERQVMIEPLSDPEAVELFRERAEAAGAVLSNNNAAHLFSSICQRVDRLPLAIELVAVRARMLTPQELLQQLDQPLQVLTHGPHDLVPRHRSLRQTIQWSYDLLGEQEQRVFRALSVFAGGCSVEAAQAVIGEALAARSFLEVLTNVNLLQRHVVKEQTRFFMLETIREFAHELSTAHKETAVDRYHHAEYYAQFAMQVYHELIQADAQRWSAWAIAEHANQRSAFQWALTNQHYETATRLALGVWRFHYKQGSLREGLAQLEAALAYYQQVPLELQSMTLRAAGTLAGALNEYRRAPLVRNSD